MSSDESLSSHEKFDDESIESDCQERSKGQIKSAKKFQSYAICENMVQGRSTNYCACYMKCTW